MVGVSGNPDGESDSGVGGDSVADGRTLTPAQLCPVGTLVNGVCTLSTVGVGVVALPLVSTATMAVQSIIGYYTFLAQSVDQAGNISGGFATRVHAFEPGVPPVLSVATFGTPVTGTTVVFAAVASDNFDLWKAIYSETFGGGFGPIAFPIVPLNTFNTAPFRNVNVSAGIVATPFVRQLEPMTADNPVAVAGQFKVQSMQGIVFDLGGLNSAAAITNLPAASVTTGVSYLDPVAYPAPVLINSWSITNPVTNVSTGGGPAAPANPTSVALTAVASGPTGTFQSPFTQVTFYAVSAAGYEPIGTATTPIVSDAGVGMGRSYSYTIIWTPGVAFPVTGINYPFSPQTIFAIGLNTNGDALRTQASFNITLTNP